MRFTLFGPAFGFYGLFHRQGATLAEMTGTLQELLLDADMVESRCDAINTLEAKGLATNHELARQLSLTMIRPLERAEVHELGLAFQSAIRAVKGIATRVGLYGFRDRQRSAGELSMTLHQLAELALTMLEHLQRGDRLDDLVASVARHQAEADGFLLVGLGELYELGDGGAIPNLEVVKWSQILDRLEEAIARVGRIATIIEGVSLKLS